MSQGSPVEGAPLCPMQDFSLFQLFEGLTRYDCPGRVWPPPSKSSHLSISISISTLLSLSLSPTALVDQEQHPKSKPSALQRTSLIQQLRPPRMRTCGPTGKEDGLSRSFSYEMCLWCRLSFQRSQCRVPLQVRTSIVRQPGCKTSMCGKLRQQPRRDGS